MMGRVAAALGASVVACLVGLPAPGSAVTVDWVLIDHPGNPSDPDTGRGAVGDEFWIAKFEVTNAQYAEFLNAKAATDPNGLFSPQMDSDATVGGITRSGSPGSYTYAVKPGFANKPVVFVSYWDAARFTNWLDNGQGSGSTETGSYTLTPEAIAANSVMRNPGADTFLPTRDEWYKAAYYAGGGVYFDFPTGTNAATGCVLPVADSGNSANCGGVIGGLADGGAYALSESPFGTFDQGGNVAEWVDDETPPVDVSRSFRGGGWDQSSGELAAASSSYADAVFSFDLVGFRVASRLPEPGAAWLGMASLAVLAALKRRRKRTR